MIRNDYRRALIMLRPVTPSRGMSGHVRLERRTLTGTMRFTVSGADSGDTLNALLMACAGDRVTVYPLGTLGMDSRGQSGMTATFDPRNLNGKDLNDYTLVALVRTGTGASELLMTGMVNGSREVNWAQVNQAAVAPFQKGVRAASSQAQGDAAYGEEEVLPVFEPMRRKAPEVTPIEEEVIVEEVPVEEEAIVEEAPIEEEVIVEEAPIEEEAIVEEAPVEEAPVEEEAIVEEAPVKKKVIVEEAPPEQTAAELLLLDEQVEWPKSIASLRVLFFTSAPITTFQLEDFVFVEAPLPSDEGTQGICAIGLRAVDGTPVSVCYALPGAFALEPPPGLEGYQYAGGWWYTVLEELEDDEAY